MPWTVLYDNAEALGLYQKIGAVFIPEENPQSQQDVNYYTVVMPRPAAGPVESVQ